MIPDIGRNQDSRVRRLARLAVFIALAAVGAMLRIPSPTGTVALDSLPGYLGALLFGIKDGMLIAALGHLLSAATAGFPLTIPVHIFIAAQMAAFAAALGWVGRRHLLGGAILAAVLNGVVAPALFIPFSGFGFAFFTAMVLPLLVGSVVNVAAAVVVYKALSRKGGESSL
ncbi:MAG: ECF transporter S component [Syntrophothermus sp.]